MISENPRALSLIDRISRIPSNRTGVVVPLVELLAASVPRPVIASARVFVLTSHDAGICLDDEYATASGRHQFTDFGYRVGD